MKVLYEMECGCRLERDCLVKRLITVESSGRKSQVLCCKKHKKRIKHKISFCEVCGVEVINITNGTPRLLCEKHLNKTAYYSRRKAEKMRSGEKVIIDSRIKWNPLDCKHFKSWCKFCVMPHFPCKPFIAKGV